jgi:hypothetical protein
MYTKHYTHLLRENETQRNVSGGNVTEITSKFNQVFDFDEPGPQNSSSKRVRGGLGALEERRKSG